MFPQKQKQATLAAAIVAAAACLSSMAQAAPVDLTSWLADNSPETPANWTFPSGTDSTLQTVNSGPAMFFNDMNSQGSELKGTIEVQTTGDDDFIGFVLGYDNDDLTGGSSSIDYILIDWKQADQSLAPAGMAISRVTGAINTCGTCTGTDAWEHKGNVEELARASTLGNVGWMDNTEYGFEIEFSESLIRVLIDGVEQFNLAGTFENGSFGFYNFSQPSVRYAGITSDPIPPIEPPTPASAPATLALLSLGLIGIGFQRRRNSAG